MSASATQGDRNYSEAALGLKCTLLQTNEADFECVCCSCSAEGRHTATNVSLSFTKFCNQ